MKIEETESVIQIFPFDNVLAVITIFKPRDIELFGGPNVAEICWPSIGSQSVEQTELFIKAMQKAVELTKLLNKDKSL